MLQWKIIQQYRYTRLADYDTLGNNPALRYTYQIKSNEPCKNVSGLVPLFSALRIGVAKIITVKEMETVITLPPEDWLKQPMITKGTINVKSITIEQNGIGNNARELRVEGVHMDGTTGYFKKQLLDQDWTFVACKFVSNAPIQYANPTLVNLRSPSEDLSFSCSVKGCKITVAPFHSKVYNSTIQIDAGSLQMSLALHLRKREIQSYLTASKKPIPDQPFNDMDRDLEIKWRGMILVPIAWFKDTAKKLILEQLFGSADDNRNIELVHETKPLDVMIPVRVVLNTKTKELSIVEKYLTQFPQLYLDTAFPQVSWKLK